MTALHRVTGDQALRRSRSSARPRSRPGPRRLRASRTTRRFALNGIGVVVALVTLFPILWMVSTAFKPPGEIFSLTPHPLPVHPTLHNFAAVMNGRAAGLGISFWTFARNSLFVTVTTVVLASVVSLLAAVAVARFRFRFRAAYLVMLLIVQMLPAQALVIPLFVDFRGIGLLDSLTGLILIYTAQALPISIWLLRNFVAAVPRDLEEAAAIDGAGRSGCSGASCSRWWRRGSWPRASSPSSPPGTSSSSP